MEQIETYFSYCLIYVSDQIINQVIIFLVNSLLMLVEQDFAFTNGQYAQILAFLSHFLFQSIGQVSVLHRRESLLHL